MATIQLELEVIGGPDKGRIFRINGNMTIIGRDPDCNIRLNDPTISAKHARIELGDTAQIVDLGSINKLQHNGQQVSKAMLANGDRVGIGESLIEVTVQTASPLEMQKTLRTGRRKGKLIILTACALLAMGLLYYGVQYQQVKAKQETLLTITNLRPIFGYPGIPKVSLPTAADFSEPPTTRYSPANANSTMLRPTFYATGGGKYKDRGDLLTATILPPDPFSNTSYKRRNWGNLSPRIGNGRFLKNEQVVLGNYYHGLINYETSVLTNPTPKALIAQVGSTETNLQFEFNVESWDSLPKGAPIQIFSLDARCADTRFTGKPLVPKMLGTTVDRRFWTKSDTTQQWAEMTQNVSNEPFTFYLLRQEKIGETLVILTAKCYAWQRFRVEAGLRNLISNQKVQEYTRKNDTQWHLEEALRLEKEADALMPNIMDLRYAEMDLYKDKWNFFRCFARYHKALCYLQIIDKWSYDDDHTRIFGKAEKIYDYVQSENGFFVQTWKAIENDMDKARYPEARKRNDELYEITRLGQEPENFVFLDEWFIYSHLTKERIGRRLSVD